MADFLNQLLLNIVDEPSAVKVNESSPEPGVVILEISVSNLDMGKVIGKGGRTIKAIRDLIRIVAVKNNTRVNVVLKEG